MTIELEQLLKQTHQSSEVDFRWINLRKLVINEVIGDNILDAGCGTGHLTLELLKRGFNVTATDYSQELIDFSKEKIYQAGFYPDMYQLDLRIDNILKKEYFDTIICLDVLEHIDDDIQVIHNLKNALKPGGLLIISVPALNCLYSRRDQEIGHYRRYNKNELRKKITDTGLSVSRIRFWNMIGLAPYFISEKLLNFSIDKHIRNNKESKFARAINKVLNLWFMYFENNVRTPIGLSLIAICKKPEVNK